MKKIILLLCLTSFSFGYSQDKGTTDFPKNEIKGNVFLLFPGAFGVAYERLINEESGAGVSLFARLSDDTFDTKFSISPYYRFYFGEKPAAGFFAEGFGDLNFYHQSPSSGGFTGSQYTGPEKEVTDFALGIGLGGKWITKKGLIFEINSGIGRNLFNSGDGSEHIIVVRGGLSIGYRFN